MGNFNNEFMFWESTCPNRKNRIECENCENCRNCERAKKKNKILDQDVEEAIAWGIDLYTRKNIFHLLHESHSV
jgi:[histone H3]-lysine4 N-trimethyltransferase ATXR3